MSTEIIEIGPNALQWSFQGERPHVAAPRSVQVDPFPAYPHSTSVVRTALSVAELVAPLVLAPKALYILSFETLNRTNGWAESDTAWDDEKQEWYAVGGTILLSGKRIPPHPALTRYVTVHEYGHHVQYDLQRRRGETPHTNDEDSPLLTEYAAMRGGQLDYGGGSWHANVKELLANDFRILVANTEVEYWPHPGFSRPEKVSGLEAWWEKALEDVD